MGYHICLHLLASGTLKDPPLRVKKHFFANIFLLNMTVLTRIFLHDTTSGDGLTGSEASFDAQTKLVLIMPFCKHVLN